MLMRSHGGPLAARVVTPHGCPRKYAVGNRRQCSAWCRYWNREPIFPTPSRGWRRRHATHPAVYTQSPKKCMASAPTWGLRLSSQAYP